MPTLGVPWVGKKWAPPGTLTFPYTSQRHPRLDARPYRTGSVSCRVMGNVTLETLIKIKTLSTPSDASLFFLYMFCIHISSLH